MPIIKRLIFGCALFIGLFFISYRFYQITLPMHLPQPTPGQEILYEYAKGVSVKAMSRDLERKGWVPSAMALEWYIRFSGNATRLHAGEYLLTSGMSARDLVEKMRKGDIFMHALRLPEGGTVQDVIALIAANAAIDHTISFQGDWVHEVSPNYSSLEGLLLPETYFYPKHETDLAILKRAYRDEMAFAAKAFEARDPAVPFKDVYETLIVASIIEKEASLPEERTKIARVIINRLAKGMPLQMDPTVIYGMGTAFTGSLTKKDLQTPGPYNTYLNRGLPPTPICLPSKNAVISALHPEEGKFLYFVSRGDGSHYFSNTLKEHNEAVLKYMIRGKKDATK